MEEFRRILEARRAIIEAPKRPERDLFAKCRRYYPLPTESRKLGWYPYFLPLDRNLGPVAEYEGREVIMLGSNNYLGLTTDPRVRQAAQAAIDRYGTSGTGSRFLNGSFHIHEELERDLADFVGKEAALVFATGFQTNLGTISALVGDGDFSVVDKDAHASIIDGANLAAGDMKTFIHNDPESLRKRLQRIPDEAGILVIVDGVYSMGGDICALPEILKVVREREGARIMVDDAHALGVLGPGGRGTAAHFGLTKDVDLTMGTFSKSLAAIGGFVAGSPDVIEFIRHHGRAMIFSASLAPPLVAAVHAALGIIRKEPERIERLWRTVRRVREELVRLGFDVGASASPVIPLIIGDELKTIAFWKALLDAGVYVNPIIYPACPPNTARLRTSYMATHEDSHIDRALDAIARIGRELGVVGCASRA